MPSQTTRIKMFLSCPSGLDAEKEVVDEVCVSINRDRGRREGFFLELMEWRTHTRPSVGGEPQRLINEQIGDDYDIFVGMLGHRFGTPTAKFSSGTEEEFAHAIQEFRSGKKIEVLTYFKDPKACEGAIDASQLLKVQQFRKRLINEGFTLFWDFDSTEQFRIEFFQHLSSAITKILEANSASATGPSDVAAAILNDADGNETDPLSNLHAILRDSESDEGFLDLIEFAADDLELMNQETNKLSDAVDRLADGIERITQEIQAIPQLPPKRQQQEAKRSIGRLNSHLSSYVQTTSQILPLMHKHGTSSVDSMSKAVAIANAQKIVAQDDKQELIDSIDGMDRALKSSLQPLSTFTAALADWPSLTRESNRMKRQVIAVNADIENFLSMLIDRLNDLRSELLIENGPS